MNTHTLTLTLTLTLILSLTLTLNPNRPPGAEQLSVDLGSPFNHNLTKLSWFICNELFVPVHAVWGRL